jgi:hypothetical protein
MVEAETNSGLPSRHLTTAELAAGLPEVRRSPADAGTVAMIVVRPDRDRRELPHAAEISPESGLAGDRWVRHCTRKLPDGRLNPDTQLTLMNSRAAALIAGPEERWPLAGDNLVVDLDLSFANLPVGQRLQLGEAIIEISLEPHTGCAKFSQRFGPAALAFVNSPTGKHLRLRGVNARVIQAGWVRTGIRIEKL